MTGRRVLVGMLLGLPGFAAGVLLSILRGGDASNTPAQEILLALPVSVIPFFFGIATAWKVKRWQRGHILLIALGFALALLIISIAAQDWAGEPTYVISDGEGNWDVEAGAYLVLAAYAGLLACAKWWPDDRSAIALTGLSAATAIAFWWLPHLPDTSTPGWPAMWLVAAFFIAASALPARRWLPVAIVAATVLVFMVWGFGFGWFRYVPGVWGVLVFLVAVVGAPGALLAVFAGRLTSRA